MAYVGTAKDLGDERKTLASVLEGEAGNQGLEGMRAVAAVIQNRAKKNFSGYGKDFVDQITADKQFQGQSSPSAAAYKIADELLNGSLQDSTGGALYYAEPGNSTAGWAKRLNASNALKIGDHYFTDNTRGATFTGPAPTPSAKPVSVALAQNAPETAMGAISGMLGGGAQAGTPSLSYAAPPSPIDQIANEANRVAASLPTAAPQFVPSTDYVGMDKLIRQNYGGLGDIVRNRFDPGFVYQTPQAAPQQPAPTPAPYSPPTPYEASRANWDMKYGDLSARLDAMPPPSSPPLDLSPKPKAYPDISQWDVFSNPSPEVFVAGANAPLPAMRPPPAPRTTNQIEEQRAEQAMLRAQNKLSPTPMQPPTIPYAEQSVVANKTQDRLPESDPRLAFIGDVPLVSSPALSVIAQASMMPPLPIPRPVPNLVRGGPINLVPPAPQRRQAPVPSLLSQLFTQRPSPQYTRSQAPQVYRNLRQSGATSYRSDNEVRNAAGAVTTGRLTENQARSLLYAGAPF